MDLKRYCKHIFDSISVTVDGTNSQVFIICIYQDDK